MKKSRPHNYYRKDSFFKNLSNAKQRVLYGSVIKREITVNCKTKMNRVFNDEEYRKLMRLIDRELSRKYKGKIYGQFVGQKSNKTRGNHFQKAAARQLLSKYLTKFTSDKKRKSPYNTIAATNCEGDPPLEID